MKFVKDVRNKISPSLAVLFNNSRSLSIFPENLKIACFCPIYKGEGTRSNPDNYRPVSVLPVLARISEKLIYEQLHAFIEPHLHSFQSGLGKNILQVHFYWKQQIIGFRTLIKVNTTLQSF